MSQENVEIVRRILGQWNAGGVRPDRYPEFFDPGVRMDLRGRKINPAVYDGYEGLDRFTSDVGEVWDQFSIELVELIDADAQVVSVMQATGRGHGSGIEVEGELAWVWTLRDGRILRVERDFDRASALEGRRAVGVGDVAGERGDRTRGCRRMESRRPRGVDGPVGRGGGVLSPA